MPDDPDTDVVKIIVGKDRYIPLIVSQSVTQVTAGLAVERFPAALRRIADGILISCDEMIEWSINETSVRSQVAIAVSMSCSFTSRPKAWMNCFW